MTSDVGPGRPPRATRFRKGQSGNPNGRPKKRIEGSGSAFEIVVNKTLTVTHNGTQREVTVEEALQHRTYRAAIGGNRPARREILKMIAKREEYLAAQQDKGSRVRCEWVEAEPDPDNADEAMLLLGIACRNPDRQQIRADREQLLLEPWAVQAALSRRRGGSKLTEKEIAEIRRCTRDPDTLRWPRGTKE